MHLCSTETRNRTRGTKEGSFVNFKGLAAAEEITGVFFFSIPSFSTLRRSRYSRQQGRGPKVKDQSFLLFIRGSWLRNCHDTFSPVSSYPFLFLPPPPPSSSSPFPPFSTPTTSYCCCCFCHPRLFLVFDVLPLALDHLSLSLSPSLCFSTLWLLSQRIRTCSFRPESFLPLDNRTLLHAK